MPKICLQLSNSGLYLKKINKYRPYFSPFLTIINFVLPAIPWFPLAGKNYHSYLAYMIYG